MSKHARTIDTAFPKRRDLRQFTRVEEAPELETAVTATPLLVEPVRDATTADSPSGAPFDSPGTPEPEVDADLAKEPEIPAEEARPEPSLRELYPPILDLPPLADSHAPLPQSRVSSAEPEPQQRRRARQVLASTVGLAASGALLFTMALPGVQFGDGDAASAASLPQQELNTGGTGDLAQTFDALNAVQVEAGDSEGSFVNYANAQVQYPFATPVGLTDPFGERSYPVAGMHDAQDFAAAEGTPIQAIADGKVIESGYSNDGCGWGLKLQHTIDGNEVTSRYCHMQMNSHDYKVGDALQVGDLAGRVGTTGMAFGAHLHFVIQVNGVAIDPMPFLLKYNRLTREK